ncbi:MAG: YidC/Oxa1 family membrane protein insertase [Clostridia bacterium]|jgi:membrane protein insertase, yidC/oxa1 family
MSFLASIFGTILNFIYNIVNNYGFAIILFSILLKVVLLPLSIKQQKTMIKTTKLQEQMKALQFKYKNNPEKLNQETIRLYKSENMSPFSGCLSAILQLVILLAVFYMVKSPLTFVKGVSEEDINNYKNELQSANLEVNQAYPEISIIRHKGKEDEKVYLNMEFLGLDLSKVPMQNLSDPKVYIIPILYILSTFISTKLTTSMNKKDKDKKLLNDHVEDYEGESKEVKEEVQEVDMMEQTNKSMSLLMPIMSISISLVAPLGLALYWLTSNVLMILERIFMNKYFKSKEEKENVK